MSSNMMVYVIGIATGLSISALLRLMFTRTYSAPRRKNPVQRKISRRKVSRSQVVKAVFHPKSVQREIDEMLKDIHCH